MLPDQARDRTTNLPISRKHARSPEPQLLLNLTGNLMIWFDREIETNCKEKTGRYQNRLLYQPLHKIPISMQKFCLYWLVIPHRSPDCTSSKFSSCSIFQCLSSSHSPYFLSFCLNSLYSTRLQVNLSSHHRLKRKRSDAGHLLIWKVGGSILGCKIHTPEDSVGE